MLKGFEEGRVIGFVAGFTDFFLNGMSQEFFHTGLNMVLVLHFLFWVSVFCFALIYGG
jgi:hypothetical protein